MEKDFPFALSFPLYAPERHGQFEIFGLSSAQNSYKYPAIFSFLHIVFIIHQQIKIRKGIDKAAPVFYNHINSIFQKSKTHSILVFGGFYVRYNKI